MENYLSEIQAENELDQGASVSAVRKYFRNKREAISAYANWNQNKFNRARAVGLCCACGRSNAGERIEYCWRAHVSTRPSYLHLLLLVLGHLHIPIENEYLDFTTYHPICSECRRELRFRYVVGAFVEAITFLLMLVGIFVALVGIGMIIWDDERQPNTLQHCFIAVAGIAMCATYPVTWRLLKRMRVLPALRHLPQRPFQFRSVRRDRERPAEE